jgi:hypothetical protein
VILPTARKAKRWPMLRWARQGRIRQSKCNIPSLAPYLKPRPSRLFQTCSSQSLCCSVISQFSKVSLAYEDACKQRPIGGTRRANLSGPEVEFIKESASY